MKIIMPNTRVAPNKIGRLFFLMGPIRGGGDWQKVACDMLEEYVGDCLIANPCRYEEDHPLYLYKADGVGIFERQLLWERYYLGHASRTGCIIAWLPSESKLNPRNDGQPYGRDTYGELGEWRGRMMHGETKRFVLGAEPGFPGVDVISRNFDEALGKKFPVYSSLEQTIAAAIGIAGSMQVATVR